DTDVVSLCAPLDHQIRPTPSSDNLLPSTAVRSSAKKSVQASRMSKSLSENVRFYATLGLTYDADGNRTKKVVGGTTTWYLMAMVNPTGYPQVVEEHTGASPGTLSRSYTYGIALISQTTASTTRFF